MILYCNGCGKKHEIPWSEIRQGARTFDCDVCNETLIVPDIRGDNTTRVQTAEPIESLGLDMTAPKAIDVMIVDDSRLIRQAIKGIFKTSKRIRVAGEASNGKEALELLPSVDPDVITLDINMPVMDGITTLKHIMIQSPKPTVMFSTLTKEGATETFDALKYGAIDFMLKPSQFSGTDISDQHRMIISKTRYAAAVDIDSVRYLRTSKKDKIGRGPGAGAYDYIAAMGASEGGYSSLLKVIPFLKPDLPAAYVVVLYAQPEHVDAFAAYLDTNSLVKVERGRDGMPIKGGVCYLTSGFEYTTLDSSGGHTTLQISPSPFPDRRGAINMLMISLSEMKQNRSAGIILSGAGEDGIEGVSEIKRQGGTIFVQDPKTCLFKENARKVIQQCEVDHIMPAGRMAAEINRLIGP